MTIKIVAISGWKSSGKDAAAKILINKGYKRVAFADVLKDRVANDFNIPRNYLDDPDFKESPLLTHPVNPRDGFALNLCNFMFGEFKSEHGETPQEVYVDDNGDFLGVVEGGMAVPLFHTPRSLAIFEGSTKRTIFPNYWVDSAIKEIKAIESANNLLTTPKDTCIVISDLRFRNEIENLRGVFGDNLLTVRVNRFDTCESRDPSERDLDNATFDITLDNKGTLEEFNAKVKELG